MGDFDTGALVGWKAHDLGSRIVLTIQTMHRGEDEANDLRERAVLVDRNQAVLLANFLYELTGQSKPQRRTWMQRLFGS